MSKIVTLKRRMAVVRTIHKTAQALSMTSFAWLGRAAAQRDLAIQFIHELGLPLPESTTPLVTTPVAATPVIIPPMVVLWGPQRGFCGAYKNILLAHARIYAQEHPDAVWVPLGPAARTFVTQHELPVWQNATQLLTIPRITPTTTHAVYNALGSLVHQARAQQRAVHILYMCARNVLVWRPEHMVVPQDLSLPAMLDHDIIHDQPRTELELAYRRLYDHGLIAYVGAQALYAEHAARAITMQTAKTNAQDSLAKLSRAYHKARQAAITNAIIELTSGAQ